MQVTHEHRELYDTTKRFVVEELNPHVEAWERAGTFPAREVFRKMGQLGLLGIHKPEAWGGLGLDYSYEMVFAEALGHCRSAGLPMAIGVQTDMATPALARFGSDELREEFLRPAIAGEQVTSIGVSEPGAGSDVAAIRTTARKDGGDYVIDGQKMWITNGTQADWCCVLANTSEPPLPDGAASGTAAGSRHGNKSLIIVPLDAKGVDRRTKLDKLGQRASDTAIIFFDQVRVPQRHLIGEEGKGFIYQMQQFQEERLFLSSSILTAMRNCIRETVTYIGQRKAFGQTILDNQYVQFKLAELKTEVEACRAMVRRATDDIVAGRDVTLIASMAKLKTARVAREVTDGCLQFWGGQGFMWDNPVAQLYRDLRLYSIGGGADEIMLRIIARSLGFSAKPSGGKAG